jgi:hypothetical protein
MSVFIEARNQRLSAFLVQFLPGPSGTDRRHPTPPASRRCNAKLNSAIASQKKRACAYAYVHESVADEFVSESKKALIELFGTDPKSNSDYSRIINAKTVTRLASLIDPAKVIAGGKSDPEAYYLDPTLLYPIAWDDKIMEDEIFGPILPILTHKTLDEAFGRIAATPLPLSISNDYVLQVVAAGKDYSD